MLYLNRQIALEGISKRIINTENISFLIMGIILLCIMFEEYQQ